MGSVMVEMTIDAEKYGMFRTDDRGRVVLGKEYGNKDVEIAILDAGEREESE